MSYNRHARRSASRRAGSMTRALNDVSRTHVLAKWFAFVALIIQVLVVQSHIHIPQATGKAQSVSLITLVAGTGGDQSGNTPRDKYPVNEDPWNCPLCQEFSHSGQFVASAAVLVSPPYFIALSFIVFSETIPSFFAVSHTWQSRAPPQS
jgi:DUF2946 family protein